jgi:ribonuclease Z
MKLTVLGSGGFLPQPDRPLPGFAIEHEGKVYLFDAGEGTQVRMVEYGISSADLEAVLVSHLHGDHLFGLPGVMVRRSQEGQRRDDLDLYAPGSIRSYLDGLYDAGALELLYEWDLHELTEGFTVSSGAVRITAAPLDHRIETYGFALEHVPTRRKFYPDQARAIGVPEGPMWSKLQNGESVQLESGRTVDPEEVSDPPPEGPSFVYLTDTRPCFDLPSAFHSPDLLVHEGMFTSEHKDHAQEKKHATATEAARVARHLEADRFLLTHFSHRYDGPEPLLAEARSTFPEAEAARPGRTLEIG